MGMIGTRRSLHSTLKQYNADKITKLGSYGEDTDWVKHVMYILEDKLAATVYDPTPRLRVLSHEDVGNLQNVVQG
jgi:hypothetical protein